MLNLSARCCKLKDLLAKVVHANSWHLDLVGRVKKGSLRRDGGVRCGRFDRTLSVVLKSLSQGFYRTFLGPKRGFDRT